MKTLSSLLGVAKKDRPLFYSINLVYIVNGMIFTLIGAILPIMQREYGMSYVLSGAVISSYQAGIFSALLLAGVLSFRIGRKRSILVLGIGSVLGATLITLSGNPLLLLVAFALLGIGRGVYSNIGNVVAAELVTNKSAGLNILHSTFSIGAFIAPFLVVLNTNILALNWRVTPWLLGALSFGTLFLIGFSTLETKLDTRRSEGELTFLKKGEFWITSFILFFYLASEVSVIGWLITYFTDTARLPATLAQSTSSALMLCVFIGRLLCAALSTRMDRNVLLVGLGALQILFFLLMITSNQVSVIYMAIFGFGLAISGIYPTILSTLSKELATSTLATGSIMAIGNIGSILMPSVVGAVAQQIGIAGGIATISAAGVLMLVLMIFKLYLTRRAERTT